MFSCKKTNERIVQKFLGPYIVIHFFHGTTCTSDLQAQVPNYEKYNNC